jgi:site-specific DNA-methyltransferase (adenine-specific)
MHRIQVNLFAEIELLDITIEQAAEQLNVSSATIRNWVKTGYLVSLRKGKVTQESLEYFQQNVAGTEKLNARANKSLKTESGHTVDFSTIFTQGEGEQMGIDYENKLTESHRNKEGIYYTPSWVVQDMFKHINLTKESTFLDPCCGSGNFLIEAIKQGVPVENVYGFDTDENAVSISIARIKQEFGYVSENIIAGDFLDLATNLWKSGKYFDVISTNPPWGKKLDVNQKTKFAKVYNCGKSVDTSSLFLNASLLLLRKDGLLGFLLQDAFFNIAVYEDARSQLLKYQIISLIDYAKPFQGLLTKAQAVIVKKTMPLADSTIHCVKYNVSEHKRAAKSFINNPKQIFNFNTNEADAATIEAVFNQKHITLAGKAKWALGIVTGNNQKYCSDLQQEGFVPVYKGADITKTGLSKPTTFIHSDFSCFQQVAPIKMYSAKEKLIYKFISSNLCFHLDTSQAFILNSANLLIPENIGISAKQLTDLLNSDILNWLFQELFQTHKVLRSDLEMLPIHTGYFESFDTFSEQNYLDYLNIIKIEDGTYRIKS